MPEKETVFSTLMKYDGIFSFDDYYMFCYNWLKDEMGMNIIEDKYSEKIQGDAKQIEVTWKCSRIMTDYFKAEVEIMIKVLRLTKIEINQGGVKVKTNKGGLEFKVKGIIVRDWQGKFETSAWRKFLRSIYEKWIITSRIGQFQGDVMRECDEFVGQAKAYLDLEGKK